MQIDLSNTKSINFDGLEVDILQLNGQTIWNAPKKFSDSTWEEISAISATGNASAYYSIGDEKTITLSTGEEITLMIVGFNHDDKADGSGKAGITIGMKNLLKDKYAIGGSGDSNWSYTSMKNNTLPTIFEQLPTDLQPFIIEVIKKSHIYGSTTTYVSTNDKLWLFSISEVYTNTYTSDGIHTIKNDGVKYEYWEKNDDTSYRIKKLNNGLGENFDWWLRTADMSSSYRTMEYITSSGFHYDQIGSSLKGVCFGFCV